jgi:hypothetical protein
MNFVNHREGGMVFYQRAQMFKLLRSPKMDSKVWYDNPIPARFLAPIDCLKIPGQVFLLSPLH